MSARLRCCLLSTVILMIAPAAVADPTIVNFDFGAVPIACSNGYAYQGAELSCPYTGPTQNFNSAPGFGWTFLQGQANGLTGPGTVFFPPSFTGLPFNQAVFLQGQNSSVSQEVGGFLAGRYTLSFYLGSRFIDCCGYDGNQTVQALIDGNVIGTWALTSFTPFTLKTASFTVTTGGTHTLEFRGINYGDHTAFLSDVNITPTGQTTGPTWDATKDFASFNPNGAWSYGSGITGTSFTLYPSYNPDCEVSGFVCWTAETFGNDPFVGFNTTGGWLNYGTAVVSPYVLDGSPGPYGDQDTIVRWTAPVAGYYDISGLFEIHDTNPTGIIGLVFRNGTLLYRGELLGPPAQHPDQAGGREDFSFSKLFLNASDVISFGVNADGDFHYDSTGFNATITIAATPCAVCSEQRR